MYLKGNLHFSFNGEIRLGYLNVCTTATIFFFLGFREGLVEYSVLPECYSVSFWEAKLPHSFNSYTGCRKNVIPLIVHITRFYC